MTYTRHKDENARLVILIALKKELDGRLNSSLVRRELDNWGHDTSYDYLRTQLDAMASLGAVRLQEIDERHVIAEITEAGRQHLLLRRVITGIERPVNRIP